MRNKGRGASRAMVDSEASACAGLTPPGGFKFRPSWVDSNVVDISSLKVSAGENKWCVLLKEQVSALSDRLRGARARLWAMVG